MLTPLQPAGPDQLDTVELEILDTLLQEAGFDFRGHAVARLKQTIYAQVAAEDLQTLRGLREKVQHDQGCRDRLVRRLLAAARMVFQEPDFYRAFREMVVPWLRTYPFIRIWHAGCASGEEVYSMAILLEEAGLYERCRLYATDADETLVQRAKEGIFPLTAMKSYTRNYQEAGGEYAFSRYYTANYDRAMFGAHLKRNIVFAQHDLGTDGSFNEFHVIICRSLLGTLPPAIQQRAHRLFHESLVHRGFLCLGPEESVTAAIAAGAYEAEASGVGIFRARQ